MRTLPPPAIGLRVYALIPFLALLALIALLGVRAQTVARGHFEEIGALVNHDMKAQALLLRMETLALSRELAHRKLRITRDRAYTNLVSHYQASLRTAREELQSTLEQAYPDLAHARLVTTADIRALRQGLDERRGDKLRHARDAAQGLSRLILSALLLSVGVMVWLLYLFVRGLIDPLTALKEATRRIRNGELSFRLPAPRGVAELQELSRSFNSMAERLEVLDSAKHEFLATVSHEIKNPLAALKEGMSLLATQGDSLPPPTRAKAFSACLIAAKRLETMINNLLHHSKMESGLYAFDFTRKNLASTVETAIEEVRPIADKKSMTLRYSGPAELPAAFNWDGMVQVFENLLINAVKYGHESSEIEVTAGYLASPSETLPRIEVAVINTGKKLDEAEMPKLFDRFFRGSNSGAAAGLGLGLHVVKRVVEAHHGEVSASCADGRTRIAITIPGQYEAVAESDPFPNPPGELHAPPSTLSH
jgi:signal transduction histidine kinase